MRKTGVYLFYIIFCLSKKTRCMLIIRYIATKNIKIGEFCFGVLLLGRGGGKVVIVIVVSSKEEIVERKRNKKGKNQPIWTIQPTTNRDPRRDRCLEWRRRPGRTTFFSTDSIPTSRSTR